MVNLLNISCLSLSDIESNIPGPCNSKMTVSLHRAYMWKKGKYPQSKRRQNGFLSSKAFSQRPETSKAVGLVKLFAYNYTRINKLSCKIVDD